MFTKEAITALQEGEAIKAAIIALTNTSSTKELAALPSDYQVRDLEPYLPLRRRARGTMTTSALDAFTGYTQMHAEQGCAVFINPDDMSATAVLNLGTPTEPGHTDNRACLKLKQTAAYRALLAHANGTGLKQATVAEFLEDWAENINCFNEAGAIVPAQAIAAIRKLSIESMRRLESSEQNLGASRSAFESVQATSVDPIPTKINFNCEAYTELSGRSFVLRLGVLTGADKPSITLRIVQAEKHAEDMANELADLISNEFSADEVNVLLGSYSKTN